MKVSEIVQLIMASVIVVAAIFAGCYQKWELMGALTTGAFALLNGNRSTTTKGATDETVTTPPASLDPAGL